MHSALNDHFEGVEIIGCLFHLIQSLQKWIKKNLEKENCLKESQETKDEMLDDIKDLAISEYSQVEFERNKKKFLSKWRTKAGLQFGNYLDRTWFGNSEGSALFPPSLWSLSQRNKKNDLDLTNNKVESFHHQLNNMFKERPELKKAIQLLKQVEEEYSQHTMISQRTMVNQAPRGSLEESQKRKRQCKHWTIKKKKDSNQEQQNQSTQQSSTEEQHQLINSETHRNQRGTHSMENYQFHFRL
jgi:hypothetical protein